MKKQQQPEVYKGYNMSLREIAEIEGVSAERIRQIEERALKKVHKMLLEKYGSSATIWDILPFWDKETHYEQMQIM